MRPTTSSARSTATSEAEEPGAIYVIVVTQGELSNKRIYFLEWFVVREFAMERAAELAKLDKHWTGAWYASPHMGADGHATSFYGEFDYEQATLAAARLAMRDPRWEVAVNSRLPTQYEVQAIRCGADTFESIERTAGSLMKALTLLR